MSDRPGRSPTLPFSARGDIAVPTIDREIYVDIMGLTWVGTRTEEHDGTVDFFANVLGLPVLTAEAGFTVLSVPDGSTVEVFGPDSSYNQHLTHPVPGFRVRDLAAAHAELVAAGLEIVLPIQGGEDRRWLHVKGPDGFVYELVQSD